jgi:hypothetical protein
MKKIVFAALCCATSAVPAMAQTHVHTAGCNHQTVDNQGTLGAAGVASNAAFAGAASELGPNEFLVGNPNGMKFILNNLGGVGAGSDALKGFTAAAKLFSNIYKDNITIRLDVAFTQLGQNILGSTGSTTNQASYTAVKTLLTLDSKTKYDAKSVSNLSGGAALTFVTNEPPVSGAIDSRTRFLDNNNSFDNLNVQLNTAQVKALGLNPVYNAATNAQGRDGTVQFSNQYTWDFDRSDGITAGAIDFVGVAAHEIGHALGFRSGVDLADVNARPGVAAPGARGLNNIAWGTVNDLFRYGTFDGQNVLDWSINSPSCHSIDKGATCTGALSTGRLNGDGRQASHWKDDALTNNLIGLMDPTATGFGGTRPFQAVTQADLIAFDVMGYDLNSVPEPATWAMMIGGFGFVGAAARRRRAATVTFA